MKSWDCVPDEAILLGNMNESSSSSIHSVDAFFTRCGLPRGARLRCHEFAQGHFPSSIICPAEFQGYCSYTLCVGPDTIVQFRPAAHRLDVELAGRASRIYGGLAPKTEFLGILSATGSPSGDDMPEPGAGTASPDLYAYSMSRIPGISLTDFRSLVSPHKRSQREDLVREFAGFFAQGWKDARDASDPQLLKLRGRVGNSLRWRLELMRAQLPRHFRPHVSKILKGLHRIESLPWVLTHGDLVPANIMVEPLPSSTEERRRLRLSGLIDWAEAEYLPFGTGMYGLEELLGEEAFQKQETASGNKYPSPGSTFQYYADAKDLRQSFWRELTFAIPELRTNKRMCEATGLAAEMGILLWHGIAFDDGQLDRVVEGGKDDEEIGRLQVFLVERADECHLIPNTVPRQPAGALTTLGVFGKVWFLVQSALRSLLVKLKWMWRPRET